MKQLQKIYTEAEGFRAKRAALAAQLGQIDARYDEETRRMSSGRRAELERLEAEREAATRQREAQVRDRIRGYTEMKTGLQKLLNSIRQWCPRDYAMRYQPRPERANEAELQELLRKVQEQGFLAWLKRLLKIGGYSSREEMSRAMFEKLADAMAYCDERIDSLQREFEHWRQQNATDSRRALEQAGTRLSGEQSALDERTRMQRQAALQALADFDNSSELREMRVRIDSLYEEGERSCGRWGDYTPPDRMPDQVLLCNVGLTLPNTNGIDEQRLLPLWIDMYTCHIIVITSKSGMAADIQGPDRELARRFIARMLKTVPPESCGYTVFDPIHQGASIGRLIDAVNVGTTDLSFDLFTSTGIIDQTPSCADRWNYLRAKPAEVIRFLAGRTNSLFEYNREVEEFEFPFSWIVDFDYTAGKDERFLQTLRELFINAPRAGYSFLFVTDEAGFAQLRELAGSGGGAELMHIDCDAMTCTQGDFSCRLVEAGSPDQTQISNFMTALKKFYDEGQTVDNRIEAVLSKYGVQLRDCSRKLTIPMALDSRGRPIDLELGGSDSVHGFISGGTNSGKSTLLHTIILSACMHYHPDDLEIWLVDYKQTEFFLYRSYTPPHIRLVGVSKTEDFTYSLLDRITAEAERRAGLMNRFNVTSLADYRKHKGELGYENLPLLLLVIDEFHEMSQFVAEDMVYRNKLENVLRETRSQGINCLLADQTFSSGLGGLTPAAKNQIGLRIAMRNEGSPQEVQGTLEVDRALYSESMKHTISIMAQGEFIMKRYVRAKGGDLTDIKLEKFKALLSTADDIRVFSQALQRVYAGKYQPREFIYVNTKEQTVWDDDAIRAIDKTEPLRRTNLRLYLGRAAAIRPCFALDIGHQPNENLSIVGGRAEQRWEVLDAAIRSCACRGYKLYVFAAEYSDLVNDYEDHIRTRVAAAPNAELIMSIPDWCRKLSALGKALDRRDNMDDTLCIFIGLEIMSIELSRLPAKANAKTAGGSQIPAFLMSQGALMDGFTPVGDSEPPQEEDVGEFNAMPIIQQLFLDGPRNGLRCVMEVSVYRQFSQLTSIRDTCRHKVAFSMGSDDCLMYLGSSGAQKKIGEHAVYSDGGKEVKKLVPYKLL